MHVKSTSNTVSKSLAYLANRKRLNDVGLVKLRGESSLEMIFQSFTILLKYEA